MKKSLVGEQISLTKKLILPPEITELKGDLIFLAGPIQGVYDWQSQAIDYIQKLSPETIIANPRRKYLDKEFDYGKQVDWEVHYLREAAKRGVILFWLAKETEHDCGRAYAQTTRFELAEFKIEYGEGTSKIVLGIEEGFTGKRYIARRFSQDCPAIKICNSLEETCEEAVKVIKTKY